MVPHVGIDLPSAPESCGPAGCALERWGRTLHTAPVSTMNCCLLPSSCKKIMPPPRAFSSRRLIRFLGSTGNQACTFSPVRRRWCGRSRCCCRLCTARGSSGGCAPGGTASGASFVRRALTAAAAGNGIDWRIAEGGDGVAPPPCVQLIGIFRHLGAILEILRNNVVYHVCGEAEQESGHEVRAGSRVRRQQGLHLSHHL
jgi:hypothetical protein